MSAPRLIRTAAVFLIAVVLIDLATIAVAARVSSTFAQSSATHIDREVRRIRTQIAGIESTLDASASRVGGAIQRNAVLSRAQMFQLLHDEVHHLPGRGMRIVAPNGQVLAWWGEDLRVNGTLSYQFDV